MAVSDFSFDLKARASDSESESAAPRRRFLLSAIFWRERNCSVCVLCGYLEMENLEMTIDEKCSIL